MHVKKLLSLFIAMALMLCGCAIAEDEGYKLGDKVADFTVTFSDGRMASLYGLLAEKRMVLVNFWATWCAPCAIEFPYMQQAYDEYSKDVGVITLSVSRNDSDEVINEYKSELGLTTLPLGKRADIQELFNPEYYPTSFIIDRNGVICYKHEGRLSSKKQFTDLFDIYVGDDYTEPVLLTEYPEPMLFEVPGSDALNAALNAPGGSLEFTSMSDGGSNLPFAPSEDGGYAYAPIGDIQYGEANVSASFTAKAGDVLAYEYLLEGRDYAELFCVSHNDIYVDLHSGACGWTSDGIRLDTDGEHEVGFYYVRYLKSEYITEARLRNVRLLTGDEARAFDIPEPPVISALPGAEYAIEVFADTKEVEFIDSEGISEMSDSKMFICDADVIDIRLLLGEELMPAFAALSVRDGINAEHGYMLPHLRNDGEGYTYTLYLNDYPNGATLSLMSDILTDGTTLDYVLFRSEANVHNYLAELITYLYGRVSDEEFEEMANWGVAHKGGDVIAKFADFAKLEAEYVVKFVNAEGEPVAGVMTQICDDNVCMVIPSDENGISKHVGGPGAYEVHVLMPPEGYERDENIYNLPETGGELTITLIKK